MRLSWRRRETKTKRNADGGSATATSARVCPACSVEAEIDDTYCSNCGASLATPVTAAAAEQRRIGQKRQRALTRRGRRQRAAKVLAAAAGVVALAAAAAAVFFVTLWRNEVDDRQAVQRDLRAARADIDALRAEEARLRKQLARTQTSLAATQRLSARRRAVLVQVNQVLKRVDPLLSSVDELRGLTGDIQDTRDHFASDAATLVSGLIAFANYLINTNPEYIGFVYFEEQRAYLNNLIETVRSEQATLTGYDSSYNEASDKFGVRADAYTQAVRKLQKQLKLATRS